MAPRRIGFGGPPERPERKPPQRREVERSEEPPSAPAVGREPRDAGDRAQPAGAGGVAGRIAIALFLGFWLVGWSAGILRAADELWRGLELRDAQAVGFYGPWLAFAVLGWLVAVWFLWRVVSGRRPLGRRDPRSRSR